MIIKTDKNYDSEFCGSLPLHLINLIQPHGVLMIVDKTDLKIVQVSENIDKVLQTPVQSILNKKLSDFVASAQLDILSQKIARWNVTDKIPVMLHFTTLEKEADFTAIVHFKNEYIIMELEEIEPSQEINSFLQIYQETKYITAALKEAKTTEEVGSIAATEIKKLSGFDRVMLYRFDEAWNGTVIAEAREEDLEPYLHLRFPASDIPKSARDLYFKNPYRLIPDRSFAPARLIPVVNPLTKNFTDLSECNLRSVPGVHVEYLKNMGVCASMSTPIIIHNQLWGLISCHHQTPKYLNYEMRSAFELLSDIVSVQLAAKENEKHLLHQSELNTIHARLLEQMYAENNFVNGLTKPSPSLLDLFNIKGAAIVYDGQTDLIGKTPQPESIKDIIKWLQLYNVEKAFATHQLSKLYTQGAAYKDTASGLIALPISVKKGNYILGFRPEVVQTIEWGGNPNEAIQFEPDGKTYHPRNSFAIWKETVKEASIPWSPQEVAAAETLRTSILERILRDKS